MSHPDLNIAANYVLFYSNTYGDPKYVGLSNFANVAIKETHPLDVSLGEVSYPTVEHYFAAYKTKDIKQFEKVRLASTPMQSKKLGRSVSLRSDWEEVKEEVMLNALRLKFANNKYKDLLLSTDDKYLIEASPYDKTWGAQIKDGKLIGRNLLGKLLMQVREEIKNNSNQLF